MSLSTTLRQAGVSRVLEPRDDGYSDAVAGFDTGQPIRPDIVVDAQTAADVASAVAVAADHTTKVTVLGSGHGLLRPIHHGLAITVRSLTGVRIDPAARTATIGAGCSWDPVVAAAAQHGLAAPCGSAPSVGVTGYLLGGGCGPLISSIGFSSDYVLSFDVVTPADGPITVSADSHPELFRAMRGGKCGFGVVTSIVVRLLPFSEIVGGGLFFAAEDVPKVLSTYAEWAPGLPATSTTSVALLRLPAVDTVPAEIRGRHIAQVRFASLDPISNSDSQLAALTGAARPLLNTVGPLPYARIGTVHNDPTEPMPVANGTASLDKLTPATIDALLTAAGPDSDLPLSSVEIRTLGHAAHQPTGGDDSVGGRSASHILNVYAAQAAGIADDTRLAAVRTALDSTTPWQGPTTLINFVGRANTAAAVAGSWSVEQRDRLVKVRREHDPDELFAFPPQPVDGLASGLSA
ncbi:FAD-binding protein [Leifsonia sp. C5G2]|uniref:FAD-binding oxidoreductase n=1 Tax=Leifsonia sp. C5G2 TaxID=2735269 RepID=UPI001584FFCC|nr:FAD-binding protein [Leifsonia sp. C5G2]NUU05599.1 FAD-binding oxidoreductase [Leifsonia sp. C5G2]